MRLLLDTHVLIWALYTPEVLKAEARNLLSAPDAQVHVSVASFWEIAIKMSLGKLRVDERLPEVVADVGLTILPVLVGHAWRVRALERFHGDPFDRLILAQALVDDLTLVARDRGMAGYGARLVGA